MVNNLTNLNKTNDHLSPQIIDHLSPQIIDHLSTQIIDQQNKRPPLTSNH